MLTASMADRVDKKMAPTYEEKRELTKVEVKLVFSTMSRVPMSPLSD